MAAHRIRSRRRIVALLVAGLVATAGITTAALQAPVTSAGFVDTGHAEATVPVVAPTPVVLEGTWDATTSYKRGDMVYYGGHLWREHQSGSIVGSSPPPSFPVPDGWHDYMPEEERDNNWKHIGELCKGVHPPGYVPAGFTQGVDWPWQWPYMKWRAGDISYPSGERVVYEGQVYEVRPNQQPHGSNGAPPAATWGWMLVVNPTSATLPLSLTGGGLTALAAPSSPGTAAKTETKTETGKTESKPGQSETKQDTAQTPNAADHGEWDVGATYKLDDEVRYEDHVYRADRDVEAGEEPGQTGEDDSPWTHVPELCPDTDDTHADPLEGQIGEPDPEPTPETEPTTDPPPGESPDPIEEEHHEAPAQS